MALTGIEIFKLLPKTNCRECGLTTCLAFAMNIASGTMDLSECPYVSEEVRAKIADAGKPPIREVTIGVGDRAVTVGGETVLFRHEKRFRHPPGIAVLVSDAMDEAETAARLLRFRALRYRRIGLSLRPELITLRYDSGDPRRYADAAATIRRNSDAHLILMGEGDPGALSAALAVCGDRTPLIHAATPDTAEEMARLAAEYGCPLVARADGVEALADLTNRLRDAGVEDIFLDPGSRELRQAFYDQIHIRRAALRGDQALGFPTIVFPCEMTDNPAMETLMAAMFAAKYAGVIVLSDFQGETLFPLLLERMELFTDPQAPPMAPEGVYEFGHPGPDAPVLLTSSWALTYHKLCLAAEEARTPVFLCVHRIDESDVLCWCHHCIQSTQRGKLDSRRAARFIEKTGIGDRVRRRKLVISQRNAQFQEELEAAIPGWEIVVGPAEAARLPAFLSGFSRKI